MRMLLVVGLLAVVSSLVAAGAVGGSTIVIRVKSVETSAVLKDKAPKGPSKGDVVKEHDKLYNVGRQFGKPSGALIGRDKATITYLSASRVTVVGTAAFPGGTVSFKGTVAVVAKGSASIRVVGGTGRYAHAVGTQSEPASDTNPQNALNVYRLTLP